MFHSIIVQPMSVTENPKTNSEYKISISILGNEDFYQFVKDSETTVDCSVITGSITMKLTKK